MEKPPSRSFMRAQWRFHRFIWNLSGGRLGRRAVGMPILELVMTGHRSGQPRSILISFVETHAGPAVAGTNAGADYDPAWVKNLRADPKAKVRLAGEWHEVTARFLEGDEWESVWGLFLENRGYSEYRRMLTRPIPLVVLEPRGAAV